LLFLNKKLMYKSQGIALGISHLKHQALKGRQNTDTQTQLQLAYQYQNP